MENQGEGLVGGDDMSNPNNLRMVGGVECECWDVHSGQKCDAPAVGKRWLYWLRNGVEVGKSYLACEVHRND